MEKCNIISSYPAVRGMDIRVVWFLPFCSALALVFRTTDAPGAMHLTVCLSQSSRGASSSPILSPLVNFLLL